MKDFDRIVNKARKQAKSVGMKKTDIAKAIKGYRG
jgi:hypothetical protein